MPKRYVVLHIGIADLTKKTIKTLICTYTIPLLWVSYFNICNTCLVNIHIQNNNNEKFLVVQFLQQQKN